jgi:hypothetical protein
LGTWWERLSHRRRGILGVFALLAVLAIAAFVTERVTGSGGHEAERAALTAYIETLRPAIKMNLETTQRVLTIPDSTTFEDYVALYHDAEKQLSHAVALLRAAKPPQDLAADHTTVVATYSAYETMYHRLAALFDHIAAVQHTPAEIEKHQVEMRKIIEIGFGAPAPRKWATDLAADYERFHLDSPQWFTDYAAQMKKLLKTLESPQS